MLARERREALEVRWGPAVLLPVVLNGQRSRDGLSFVTSCATCQQVFVQAPTAAQPASAALGRLRERQSLQPLHARSLTACHLLCQAQAAVSTRAAQRATGRSAAKGSLLGRAFGCVSAQTDGPEEQTPRVSGAAEVATGAPPSGRGVLYVAAGPQCSVESLCEKMLERLGVRVRPGTRCACPGGVRAVGGAVAGAVESDTGNCAPQPPSASPQPPGRSAAAQCGRVAACDPKLSAVQPVAGRPQRADRPWRT